jgi:hypothetical protein
MGADEDRLSLYATACRQRAARTPSPILKQRLLFMADQYEREIELLTDVTRLHLHALAIVQPGRLSMESVTDLLHWLEAMPPAVIIDQHKWAFTTVEVVPSLPLP